MSSLILAPDDDGLRLALKEMNELHVLENEGYTTHVVSSFPNIRDLKERVSFGTFSWTLHKSKLKLLNKSFVQDIGVGPQTPSSIAREYLAVRYKHLKRRATLAQKMAIVAHRSAPLYFRPAHIQDAVYVDIVSTYWTLMLIGGWNVDYKPAGWIAPGRAPIDFPCPTFKLARNCLVSLGLSSANHTWNNGRFSSSYGKNPYINYGLWAFVQDTLHCLAVDALECGALYVHTDGYILPSENTSEFFARCSSWGIPVKVKARGNSWIMGVGNYKVGDYVVRRPKETYGRPFSNVELLPYREWLRRNVKQCIEKRLSERVYYNSHPLYNNS